MRYGPRSLAALLALALLPAPGAVAGGDPPKVEPRLTDRPGSDLLSLCLNIRDTNGRAPIEKRN
jgi:hypothetical protein